MRFIVFMLCQFGIGQAIAAELETLRFSNGDQITGEVVAKTDSHTTLKSQFGQELVIPNELLQAKTPEITPEEVVAASEPVEERNWESHITLNSTFSRGNTDSQLINLQGDYALVRDQHRYKVDLSSLREEKEGDKVKEQDRLNLGYNYLYSEKWFFAMNATLEQDPVALLEHRISLNPAIGYDIWNESDRALNVQFGAGYSSERVDDEDESSSLIDWRLNYTQNILNGQMEIFHKHQIYRNMQGRRNTVFNSQTGARYELNNNIYLNVQLNYDYDTEPAQNTDSKDVTFLVGAGVTL